MRYKKYLISGLACISLLYACSNNIESAAGAGEEGNAAADLFASKCSMCHAFKEDKIGPSLAGVQQRWGGDTEKLKAFIRNSQSVINSGDPYATALYQKWNQSAMPSFEGISEAEMNALIDYLK